MFKVILISIILFINIYNSISADFNESTFFETTSTTLISTESTDEYHSTIEVFKEKSISISEYPFMARISFVYEFSAIVCGGILIHSRYVLTAKHCYEPGIKHILVCMGSAYLPKVDSCEKDFRFAYRVVKRKNFDVMILILVIEFRTSPEVKPIDDYGFNSTMLLDYKYYCTVLGWGQTDPVKALSKDLKSNKISNITIEWNEHEIFGYSNQSTGFANAGGPLVCEKKVIGLEIRSSTTDAFLEHGWTVFLNLNKQREFIDQVLTGVFDKSGVISGNKILLLVGCLCCMLMATRNNKLCIVVILLGSVFCKQEIMRKAKSFNKFFKEPYPYAKDDNQPVEKSSEQHSTLAFLYLYDASDQLLASCSGSFISSNWIISSGSCLKQATDENTLQVCHGCCQNGSTFATKIVFPRHEWYNNFAFVETDGSLAVNATIEFTPEGENANLTNCKMSGFIQQGKLTELNVVVRRGCRVGYYCVDEKTGLGCDLQLGSVLSCENKIIGISTGYHPMTCDYLFDDDFDDEEDGGLIMRGDDVEDWHTANYALLFFIKFDAYEELITKIINDTFRPCTMVIGMDRFRPLNAVNCSE